ncbi:unnamed protein product [Clonostachys solani]|uniref:Uncharacterized protein n=1 Tax=Clonostachys solani TaxID=160281 RepID=A0A9P0ER68_9HYPO|nr:unnamed protein product [Clonostachys solani]
MYSATDRCNQAASIAELFDEKFGLSCAPISSTQFIFTAGAIHLRSVVRSKNAEFKLEAVEKCIAALNGMGQTWKCAALSGDALQRLLEDWQAKAAKSATHAQRTRVPSEGIGNSPTSIQSIDIQHMLRKDPDVAAQLRRLGWMPPEEAHISLQGFHNPDFETLLTGMDSQNTLGICMGSGTRSDLSIADGPMTDVSWMAQAPGWMYFPSTDGLPQVQQSLFDMVQSGDRPVAESWLREQVALRDGTKPSTLRKIFEKDIELYLQVSNLHQYHVFNLAVYPELTKPILAGSPVIRHAENRRNGTYWKEEASDHCECQHDLALRVSSLDLFDIDLAIDIANTLV